MADPYQTLNIPRDASAADVRKAYRRKSSKAHPDKGGSDQAMAEINRAYEVLGDPQRRLQYDQTGETAPRPSIEVEARAALLEIFSKLLAHDDINITEQARAVLANTKALAESQRAELRQRRKVLEKRRSKVKTKSGENLVHQLIDQQLVGINRALAQIEHNGLVFVQVMELLASYESTEEVTDPFSILARSSVFGSSSTSTRAW